MITSHTNLPPPVIVLGMHRSGTSLLTEMLQACGLFIGRRYDHHFETPFFQRLNLECLRAAGATWYQPEPFLQRRKSDPAFDGECLALLQRRLDSRFAMKYLGWRQATGIGAAPISAWGWKDPRTCLTADLWSRIFPEARLLHVVRHPLDVAISLERREVKRREEGHAPIPENTDLEHNLRLWDVHVEACRQCEPGNAYFEIRYETLIADPETELRRIAPFCRLEPAPEQLRAAAAIADGTRTRRFDDARYAPWLARLAEMPLARELGYV